jgi:hypothetical protein
MIDTRFCARCGTAAQHAYICRLASSLGYGVLRYAVAEATGRSVSSLNRCTITIAEASIIIDWLKAKKEDSSR